MSERIGATWPVRPLLLCAGTANTYFSSFWPRPCSFFSCAGAVNTQLVLDYVSSHDNDITRRLFFLVFKICPHRIVQNLSSPDCSEYVLTGLFEICPHRIVQNMSSPVCPKYILTGLFQICPSRIVLNISSPDCSESVLTGLFKTCPHRSVQNMFSPDCSKCFLTVLPKNMSSPHCPKYVPTALCWRGCDSV